MFNVGNNGVGLPPSLLPFLPHCHPPRDVDLYHPAACCVRLHQQSKVDQTTTKEIDSKQKRLDVIFPLLLVLTEWFILLSLQKALGEHADCIIWRTSENSRLFLPQRQFPHPQMDSLVIVVGGDRVKS